MDKVKRFFHFLASVFMYSVLLIMFIVLITVVVYIIEEKKNIDKDRYVSPLFSAFVIISQSMEPTIKVNDVVIAHKALPSSIEIGDIITFVSNDSLSYGKIITHRVVGKDQDSEGRWRFRTKGDNNNTADNWIVPETHILGSVMFKIPQLGYVQQFLATSYGWLIAIVLPCLVIIIYDIVKLLGTLIKTSNKNRLDQKKEEGILDESNEQKK